MSIEATHYVMKTDIPDGIAKLVAFVIADYAHAETGQAWPKIATLACKCSQSVRTVQRKIRVLEELGILRIEQRQPRRAASGRTCSSCTCRACQGPQRTTRRRLGRAVVPPVGG